MEPRIASLPAFTVVGIKYHGKNENNEIKQMWNDFGPRMGEIKHKRACYGVCANEDNETHEFDYFAGFEVDSTDDIPEGMVSYEVPASTYAAFRTTLPAIGQTFDHAYQKWLPQSGYHCTDGPDLELYDEEFDPSDPESTFEIFVPITS
jgi:AraC family transcriptional regulator